MNTCKNILYYFKYVTFVLFLYASIVLFPNLITLKMGIVCLILIILFSIVTFVMFFLKKSGEQFNILNNFVLCLLHLYFCFIAYRYQASIGSFNDLNNTYFTLNYFVTSLCLFTLTVNKFILFYD